MALPKGEKLLPPISLFSDAAAERKEARGHRGTPESIIDNLIGEGGRLVVVKPSENPGKLRRRTRTDTWRRMMMRGLFRRDGMPLDCSIFKLLSINIIVLTTRRYPQL